MLVPPVIQILPYPPAWWILAVVLLSLRIGAALLATPMLSYTTVPVTIRILVVVGLSCALGLGIGSDAAARLRLEQVVGSLGALVEAAAAEVALGATFAVAIHMAFAAFAIAGRILDVQVGFGLAQVFDPTGNQTLPVLTTVFNQAGALMFFLVNGHHAFMRTLQLSLERFPLGKEWPISGALEPLIKNVSSLFALAFSLAAPVIFCILLVELALGVIARNLPQMNMLTMGTPIKIVVGLVALSLWYIGIGAAMDRVYREIYQTWNVLLASAGHASFNLARAG